MNEKILLASLDSRESPPSPRAVCSAVLMHRALHIPLAGVTPPQ